MEEIFTGQYRVRYYETGCRGTVRPVTILDYLQDAASGHSLVAGFSVRDLRKSNMTWVLSRYHVLLQRYPVVGELLQVRTWRSRVEGHFALREFEVTDEGGSPVALASSSWVIIDLKTKRPVKIENVVADMRLLDKRPLDDDFKPLPKLGKAELEQCFQVRMADMDMNNHVNHTVYVQWVLESVPQEILRQYILSEIEITYRAEAFYGDTVIVRTERIDRENDSPVFVHQLVNTHNDRELTRMKTCWRQVE